MLHVFTRGGDPLLHTNVTKDRNCLREKAAATLGHHQWGPNVTNAGGKTLALSIVGKYQNNQNHGKITDLAQIIPSLMSSVVYTVVGPTQIELLKVSSSAT